MDIDLNYKKAGTGASLWKISVLSVFLSAFLFFFAFHCPANWAGESAESLSLVKAESTESNKDVKQGSKSTVKAGNKKPLVTVYVTSWCPACNMTINYLKKKKIPFTVKDIEKNPAYMREMVKKAGGYRGVPVLEINGKTYLGFHPSIIDNLDK